MVYIFTSLSELNHDRYLQRERSRNSQLRTFYLPSLFYSQRA